jgi:hypothetical protein
MSVVAMLLLLLGMTDTTAPQKNVELLTSAHRGRVAVWAKHLTTGQTLAIDADTPVKTASVIKLAMTRRCSGRARSTSCTTVSSSRSRTPSGT